MSTRRALHDSPCCHLAMLTRKLVVADSDIALSGPIDGIAARRDRLAVQGSAGRLRKGPKVSRAMTKMLPVHVFDCAGSGPTAAVIAPTGLDVTPNDVGQRERDQLLTRPCLTASALGAWDTVFVFSGSSQWSRTLFSASSTPGTTAF